MKKKFLFLLTFVSHGLLGNIPKKEIRLSINKKYTIIKDITEKFSNFSENENVFASELEDMHRGLYNFPRNFLSFCIPPKTCDLQENNSFQYFLWKIFSENIKYTMMPQERKMPVFIDDDHLMDIINDNISCLAMDQDSSFMAERMCTNFLNTSKKNIAKLNNILCKDYVFKINKYEEKIHNLINNGFIKKFNEKMNTLGDIAKIINCEKEEWKNYFGEKINTCSAKDIRGAFIYIMDGYFEYFLGKKHTMAFEDKIVASQVFVEAFDKICTSSSSIDFQDIYGHAQYILKKIIKSKNPLNPQEKNLQKIIHEKFARYGRLVLRGNKKAGLRLYGQDFLNKEKKILGNLQKNQNSFGLWYENFKENLLLNPSIVYPLKLIILTVCLENQKIINKNTGLREEFKKFFIAQGQSISQLYTTSYHEAAHGFLAGNRFIFGTSIVAGNTHGQVNHQRHKNSKKASLQELVDEIKIFSGGILGEYSLTSQLNALGATWDFDKAIDYAKILNEKINDHQKENKHHELPLMEKLRKWQKNGERDLKNIKNLRNPTIGNFLEEESLEKIDISCDEDDEGEKKKNIQELKGLLAGIIGETWKDLTHESNYQGYTELAEVFFYKKIVTQDLFQQIFEEKKAQEVLLRPINKEKKPKNTPLIHRQDLVNIFKNSRSVKELPGNYNFEDILEMLSPEEFHDIYTNNKTHWLHNYADVVDIYCQIHKKDSKRISEKIKELRFLDDSQDIPINNISDFTPEDISIIETFDQREQEIQKKKQEKKEKKQIRKIQEKKILREKIKIKKTKNKGRT